MTKTQRELLSDCRLAWRRGHGFDLLWSGYQDRSIATVGRLAR